MEKCDLFVIGGGSGGVRAARLAAQRGLRVVLAEKSRLGGTCVNVGCVPKKLFYYAAGYAEEWRHADAYGRADAALGAMNWQKLRDNKDAEIRRLNAVYQRILTDAGVRIVHAAAKLTGADKVEAGGEIFSAKHILLATGGAPTRANIPGAELAAVSDDLFSLPALPKKVILLGGGYIALEFAGIFAGLGVETTLCLRADLPMRGLDDDIRQRLADGMRLHGISVRGGVSPLAVEKTGDGFRLNLDGGEYLSADLIVFATGRKPATDALGLETIPLPVRPNGTLEVDADYRTACPTVYAVGDLLQTPALTPVATAEAETFVKRVFDGDKTAAVDYDAAPTAIFSRPSAAVCGLGEQAARQRGIDFAAYTGAFKPMKSSFAADAAESFVKLLVNRADGRVVGAQMLGEHAAEIMQGIAVAIKAGATKSDFDGTVGIHPTSAEEFVVLRQER